MRYRVGSRKADRLELVFSMPERPLIIVFLSVASLVCLVAGLGFALGGPGTGDALSAVSFLGFGLFCLSAIFLVAGSRPFPARLVFDNAKGRLEVLEAAGRVAAAVPYHGIAGLSVRPTMYNRVMRSSLGIDLERGGRWELYASRVEKRAEDFRQAIAAAVKLDAPAAGEPFRPAGGGLLGIDRSTPGTLRCTWRRKSRPVATVLSAVILLSFVAAMVAARPFAAGAAASIVTLAFGGFFLAVAAVGVLRAIGEKHEVVVERGAVRCRRTAALTREKAFDVPLSQLASVDLSTSFSRVGARIVFLRPEDVERFAGYRQGTFPPSETIALAAFLRRLPHLDVSALGTGERLLLAELIRETVESRGR